MASASTTSPAEQPTAAATGEPPQRFKPANQDAAALLEELGPGAPLDSGAASRIGSLLGQDFSGVQVHTDAKSAALVAEIGARAVTVGEHVIFSAGAYKPGTVLGDALLAHELAHVVQQQGATPQTPTGSTGGSAGDRAEQEAESAGVSMFASLWGKARKALSGIRSTMRPKEQSGLALQSCNSAATPRADVKRVEFTGNHALTHHAGSPEDKTNPVWTPGATDHAAAFTQATAPTVNIQFQAQGDLAGAGVSDLSLRVKEGGAVKATQTGIAPAATVNVAGLSLAGLSNSDKMRQQTYTLAWEGSKDGTTWVPLGNSGPHLIYWLAGAPQTAPLYDLAAAKATFYVDGSSDPATALRSGPRRKDGMAYSPSDAINPDPLTVLTDGVGICTDYANLLTALALSSGLTANAVMYFGGFQSMGHPIWVTLAPGLTNLLGVRSPDPAFNPGPAGWSFNYHAISRIQGALHDAALDRADVDGTAAHGGKIIHLVEAGAPPPEAEQGQPYSQVIPRKDQVVEVSIRDYGPKITSADFNLVYPVQLAVAAASPHEVAVTWVLADGALPAGVTLDPATGRLQGTPTAAGDADFKVKLSAPAIPGQIALVNTFPVKLKVKPQPAPPPRRTP